MFNAESFLNAVTTQALDDRVTPCPPGEWPAVIVALTPKSGTIGKGERAGEPWARLDVQWEITDASVAAVTKRDKTRVRQGIMLDLNASGALDESPGKNIQLGKLRSAMGLNAPGAPFSPNMLLNRSARVNVKHSLDERDGQTIQAEVNGVVKL